MIRIINKINLTKDGLFVKGTKQLVHLQQGSLDGACAVYSMMMCLIMNKVIKRKDVTDLYFSHDGRTSNGRLVKLFLEHKGLIRNGYDFISLKADLYNAFRKRVNVSCCVSKFYAEINCIIPSEEFEIKTTLIEDIIEALDSNEPVEIGFTRKKDKSGHAIVAIGYARNQDGVSFFCLDPGFDLSKGQLWNNILQVNTDSTAKYNCLNYQEESVITIDELLVIEPK